MKSSQTPSGSHHRQSRRWTCMSGPRSTGIIPPDGTYPPVKKNEERPDPLSKSFRHFGRHSKSCTVRTRKHLPPPWRISLLDRPCQRHQRSFEPSSPNGKSFLFASVNILTARLTHLWPVARLLRISYPTHLRLVVSNLDLFICNKKYHSGFWRL